MPRAIDAAAAAPVPPPHQLPASTSASPLTRPAPALPCLLLAFAIGLGYALFVFGIDFASGRSAFWLRPIGIQGGALDIRTSLSAYYWFAQAPWDWPILWVTRVNPPHGVSAYLFDFVPVAALAGKVVSGAIGRVVNPYPAWVVGSFALNAAALAILVRACGQRSLLAAALAAAVGAMMPMVHHRFGHLALPGHWPFILALACIIAVRRGGFAARHAILGLAVLVPLAAAINMYVFVMVGAIGGAALVQMAIARQLTLPRLAGACLLVFVPALLLLVAFGLFDQGGVGTVTHRFGFYSMNLLSPFWPASSGLFSATGLYVFTRGSIGATGGQYEGYNYLGAGVLLLLVISTLRHAHAIAGLVRRYWLVAATLLFFAAWAISNHVYFGPFLLFSYPVPDLLERTVLGWFRGSGRFFWPVTWTLAALALVGVLAAFRGRRLIAILAIAVVLQWVDLSIWRDRLGTLARTVPSSAFGEASAELEDMIATAGRVEVVPRLFCSSVGADYAAVQNVATLEVQLMAARTNAAMADVLLGRGNRLCDQPPLPLTGHPFVRVFLSEALDGTLFVENAARYRCVPIEVGSACWVESE